MPDEPKTTTKEKEEQKKGGGGGGGQGTPGPVGTVGIALIAAYLILFCILLLHGLVQLWPPATLATGAASTAAEAKFLLWGPGISDEVRLILIVALVGALGGLVHAIRSLYCYVGNRRLERSWLMQYVLLPFLGTALALAFYFVIRGGFFSPESEVRQTNPFGFAALAGLVGMFSEQAIEKLRQVANTLLSKPSSRPGEESEPQ